MLSFPILSWVHLGPTTEATIMNMHRQPHTNWYDICIRVSNIFTKFKILSKMRKNNSTKILNQQAKEVVSLEST
jgi:hypothetical protein